MPQGNQAGLRPAEEVPYRGLRKRCRPGNGRNVAEAGAPPAAPTRWAALLWRLSCGSGMTRQEARRMSLRSGSGVIPGSSTAAGSLGIDGP